MLCVRVCTQHASREKGVQGPLTSKDYTTLQLKVQFDDDDTYSEIDPGARLDPEGHNAYSSKLSSTLNDTTLTAVN